MDFSLYLATDRAMLGRRDLLETVAAAVAGGVSAVQLREKNLAGGPFHEVAAALQLLTRRLGVPLIINDRVDVMLAVDAEGVHVGRGDLPLGAVRRLASSRVVGYSVNNLAHLRFAESAGADYVGAGPVFATATKTDTGPVLGLAGLREIVQAARIPCIAIGGITADNIAAVAGCGAAGCCVISAILAADDPERAARDLKGRWRAGRG